jgi:hypothetical protein
MEIRITKLDSSIIQSFAYDTTKHEMLIEFNGGSRYLYKNVNEVIVSEFIDAESKGKYINEIKKDYEFDRVDTVLTGTA